MALSTHPHVPGRIPKRGQIGARNFDPLASIHPHVAELLNAEVPLDSTPHQLRQELRVLRDLLVEERKKVKAMKEELELEKAKAPVIYSGFDFFSIRDPPRHQLKPKEKPLPKQYVITRAAGDEILHADHLPDTPEYYRFYQHTDYGIDPMRDLRVAGRMNSASVAQAGGGQAAFRYAG